MTARDDLLEPFVVEGRDLVTRARADLTRLGQAPGDRAALDGLFRSVHTLKGSTSLFDLPVLTRLLHKAEARLEHSRGGEAFGEDAGDLIVRVLDVAEGWIDALESGAEPSPSTLQGAEALSRALQPEDAPPAADALAAHALTPEWASEAAAGLAATGPVVALRYTPASDAYFRGDDPLAVVRAIPGLAKLEVVAEPPADPVTYDPFRCTLQITAVAAAPLEEVRGALRLVADQVAFAVVEEAAAPRAGLHLRTLHVDAARLDAVASIVDELVIAKNALAYETRRLAAGAAGTGLARDLLAREAALERLTGDLHAAVTGLRLTPLGNLFSRFPRLVRDIAADLGKAVDLRVTGDDVALDKSAVEGLFEPLLHLVRNAVGHGVEDPAVRRAAGKPERAAISLSAEARGVEVLIELADDGRGIDLGATRRLAVARGVLSQEAADGLSDAAAAELVFAAGLSTAAQVSDLSGRGVGMDAVRTAVTRLGGQVALDNRPGQGLAVRLTLPAQLLLKKILVVSCGADRFGVPLELIQETHRVRRDELTAVRESRAYLRRDTVIPMLRLADLLGLEAGPEPEAFPVLNITAGGDQIGVQVDAIGERLEAPMRPMIGLLAGYPGVLGTVVQGDGRVLLILDLAELAA